MSTNSVIALPAAGGGFRGRFCHWDGYPCGVGRQLWLIVRRDGLTAARLALTRDLRSWSKIDADQGSDDPHYVDPRWAVVPGYGVAENQPPIPATDWLLSGGDDWGTEWAYVLGDQELVVYRRAMRTDGKAGRQWQHRVDLPYDAPEPDWSRLDRGVTE